MEESQITEYTALLESYNKIPKGKEKTITFLELGGFPHYENVISNLLAFYFDPQAEHKFDDLLVKSLLEICLKKDIPDTYQADVRREVVTENNKRIDLVIDCDEVLILIENKVFSSLHNDLHEYSSYLQILNEKEYQSKKKMVMLVLSPYPPKKTEKEKTVEADFLWVTYNAFFKGIKKNLPQFYFKASNRHIIYLTDLMESVKNTTQKMDKNIKIKKFVSDNYSAIRELSIEFDKLNNQLNKQIIELNELLEKFQSDLNYEVKIWKKTTSYIDVRLKNKKKFTIETRCYPKRWELQLHLRQSDKKELLKQVELFKIKDTGKSPNHLPDRILYKEYKFDEDIQVIANEIESLMTKVEVSETN